MTLNGEFEKVHYPMPLSFLEEPDIGLLRKTFTRMQSQANMMSSSNAFSELLPQKSMQSMDDFATLEDENSRMRRDIEEMERVFSQTDN